MSGCHAARARCGVRHGVKDKHLAASRQVAREPITGLPHGTCWPVGRWIGARRWFGDQRAGYPSSVQPAFDGCQRRHWLKQLMLADLLVNASCTDQAELSLLQGAPELLDNQARLLAIGLGCMHWSTLLSVQSWPSQAGKALPAFAQPLAFASNGCENIARAPAFEPQSNRLAAPVQFVIIVCDTASFGDSMAAITPCPR